MVSDTAHVSHTLLRGSTGVEVLMEVNRELQMGGFQAVPAGILVPAYFWGGEKYLPHLCSSSRFIQLHPKALREVQRVAGAEV